MRNIFTATSLSAAATLWLVAAAAAWPTPTAQQRAACQQACEGQLHQCIGDAKDTRNACRASCQPMRDAQRDTCADGNGGTDACRQAKSDMQDCTQSCEAQYRSDRDNCNQTAHDCKDQCSLAATDTPTPEVNTPTDTPAPADTATNTPAPADTATNTPAPADTATNTPAPADTATNTPAPADTATNTPAPADTATNTPAPAATATNTPAPADTATNTPAPAATATNTPAPAATATNTPAPADTATNTPAPAATATNTAVPPTATNTPAPADTATNTPAPAATATNTAVPPTATNTAVPPTPTDTPLPAATATNTAVPATSTPTPTETPAGTDIICTFDTGTQTVINDGGVSVTLPLTGHSELVFSPADANGIRTILVPHTGTHVDCIKLPLNSGVACVRADYSTDGFGFVDCNGTTSGYNLESDQDHNSNNGNNPGFDPDPSCTNTFTEPDGSTSPALLEDGSAAHPHTGVCNSPIHTTSSGTFPAGGTHLSERQILRQMAMPTSCTPNPCPPDDTPFDASAGDTHFNLLIGSGHSGTTIFDLNNVDGQTLSGSIDGAVSSCTDIDAGDLSHGSTAGAFPGLDENVLGDSVVTFQIKCKPPA
jgi:hypothetical protein